MSSTPRTAQGDNLLGARPDVGVAVWPLAHSQKLQPKKTIPGFLIREAVYCRIAQEFEAVRVVEGEDLVERLEKKSAKGVKALQMLTMLGWGKDEDGVWIQLVLILASSTNDQLLQCLIDPPEIF